MTRYIWANPEAVPKEFTPDVEYAAEVLTTLKVDGKCRHILRFIGELNFPRRPGILVITKIML